MNAKLWIWWNDDAVKLTLSKDQSIELVRYERTDEGYSKREEKYTFDGEYVLLEGLDSGRDCDGYIERNYELKAHIDSLQDINHFVDGIKYPHWEKVSEGIYDQQAQAAGY